MEHRRTALALAVLLVAGGCTESQDAMVARARAIHQRVITMDTHDDIPANFGTPEVNPCENLDRQVDVPAMREGGLDVAFFAVYVGQAPRTPENYERAKEQALQKFAGIHRMAEELCPDQIEIAYHPDDVRRIVDSGKLVTVIGMENGFIIGKDLSLLKTYYDLGGRYLTLAHMGHNDIADTSTPSPDGPAEEWGGLSPFGEQVVAEMNRLGMMVDVSHISKKAALAAMRVSKAPVIASHSSVQALANVPRNMDDETLQALKENGGVIQIVAVDDYIKVPSPEKTAALAKLREEMGMGRSGRGGGRGAAGQAGGARSGGSQGGTGRAAPGGRRGRQAMTPEQQAEFQQRMTEYRKRVAEINQQYPGANVKDLVDHIDYAVKLIGIDHVGISSDFDGGGGIEGWNNASETFNVTEELVRRGYTEEQIAKLWGGNLLRVWREVERVAAELQNNPQTD